METEKVDPEEIIIMLKELNKRAEEKHVRNE
jgi:hypothetical protein